MTGIIESQNKKRKSNYEKSKPSVQTNGRSSDPVVWDPPSNQNMISEAGRMKLGMI
jgi:hypothetical protein